MQPTARAMGHRVISVLLHTRDENNVRRAFRGQTTNRVTKLDYPSIILRGLSPICPFGVPIKTFDVCYQKSLTPLILHHTVGAISAPIDELPTELSQKFPKIASAFAKCVLQSLHGNSKLKPSLQSTPCVLNLN